ncbi:MAG: hypothetical protein JXQ29_07245 [Planctomycetes bacterium]|nr:hypothetical protein [Planctomycetota bacterium]
MIGADIVFALSLRRPEALVFLVLAVPIALAYLVDPIRRRSREPFLFLWASLAAPRPWLGRLRRAGELALLLAALTLLVLAVADPGGAVLRAPARFVLLAVVPPAPGAPAGGAAASVLAGAVGRRLESVGPTDGVCVVVACAEAPRVLVPPRRGPVGEEALAALDENEGPADRTALAGLVARLAERPGGAEVHWIDPAPPAGLPATWHVHAVGAAAPSPDIAIVLARLADGALVAEATNRGPLVWRGVLRLRGQAAVRTVAALAIEPGASRRIPVELEPGETGEICVEAAATLEDWPLARASHFVPPRGRVRVLVVARGGRAPLLEILLAQLADRVDPAGSGVADSADAAALRRLERAGDPYDLAIFLEPPDPELPVAVPVLVFGGAGPLGRPREGEPARAGGVATWQRRHPLLSWVDFSPVVAEGIAPVAPAAGVEVLAEGPVGPMLLYRPGPPPRAAFPFRLERSNLALEWAFTTLLSNLIRVWGGERPELGPCAVGAPFPVPAPAGPVRVGRHGEGDVLWQGEAGEGFPFRPRRAGRFAAVTGSAVLEACFNPGGVDPAWAPPAARAAAAPVAEERGAADWRSAAALAVWIALGVLLLEWALYHRGVR